MPTFKATNLRTIHAMMGGNVIFQKENKMPKNDLLDSQQN
jgi:hypothetical protein